MHKKLKIIYLGLFLLIILSGVIAWYKLNNAKDKIFVNSSSQEPTRNQTIDSLIKNNSSFNILLLGYGGGNHDGAYLTDSIVIVNIIPQQKKITLISIPRDIWVKIP